MTPFQSCSVAVLIATASRPDLLLTRALPSISSQARIPSRVVVVDDSLNPAAAGQTERIVRGWQPTGINVEMLRNRRTKGAAGSWNSGLDHILRTCPDPTGLYVAILDDDDQWTPNHLELCLLLAERHRLDMVATPFLRMEEASDPRMLVPPQFLRAEDFFAGNPGIQASNLFCRLSVLLEAGFFDESLPSCTDRDLCIRIADLPGVRYGTMAQPTVHHFACHSRPRLSTPGSTTKRTGLDRFFRKYHGRMSPAQRDRFLTRSRQLFDWEPTPTVPPAPSLAPHESAPPEPHCSHPPPGLPHLVVGIIADTSRQEELHSLLSDLRAYAANPGLAGLDVLILENGPEQQPDRALRALVESERARGLRIHLADRARQREDAAQGLLPGRTESSGRLSIAFARTTLQSYLYAFAKARPGAVVWIIDDDMRLDPLVAKADGRIEREPLDLVSVLQELRRLHVKGEVDIAIGAYSGAPPLPFTATVRVQLVDLVASLQWLAEMTPNAPLPDRSHENAMLRSGRRDYYYDLSRTETDRLEAPFLIIPEFPGERVGEAFERIAQSAERILAGEQVFRPLVIEAEPLVLSNAGNQRGGNTFVLDIQSLRLAPNPALPVDGRPTRRSDMLWALLQQRCNGKRVRCVNIALHHDRSRIPPAGPDVERIVDDIRGYAILSALQDTPEAYAAGNSVAMHLDATLQAKIVDRVHKFLEERLAAFRLSFHRIRGLARILRQWTESTDGWWSGPRHRVSVRHLRCLADRLIASYPLETLQRIERDARALDAHRIHALLADLPAEITEHRKRLENHAILLDSLAPERIANARSTVARLATPLGTLTALGCGAEGVSLSDGTHVYKVFDCWKQAEEKPPYAFLRPLAGAWSDARSLYPLLDFHVSGHSGVLVYPYEPSEPYTGGRGPGLVELLSECRRHGIVCRNIHPDNLRVVGDRVRLIDYGCDILPFTDEEEYTAMCRRAWLTWRWTDHADLKAIMRRALTDPAIPELDGFERFHEAVLRSTGRLPRPEDHILDMAGSAERVLDYGCGKGWHSRQLADRGMQVVGYDPDPAYRPRWRELRGKSPGLQFTNSRAEVISAAPFDLVICRRVLCTIESDTEFQDVLDDLRVLVSDGSRVLASVCDPNFTFGGPSPEADRFLPADAHYENTFAWRKSLRSTGSIRCDVHRPERSLRRAFARANFTVSRRAEEPSVDLERFEPMSDQLTFELRPLPPLPHPVTLLIKACAMESATLSVHVRHLVTQLEAPRAFAERILVIDPRECRFPRQHTLGNLRELHSAAQRLLKDGWIDRIVEGPKDGPETAELNRRWFGLPSPMAHTAGGAPVAATLAGFEACQTRFVLHVDADIMVGRLDRGHDFLSEMLEALHSTPGAITVSLNIAMEHDRAYTYAGPSGPWRVEVRAGMIDLQYLRDARPLPNRLQDNRLALAWHRSLDRSIESGTGRSLRGGDRRTFFVHPSNARKRDLDQWFAVLDRIEHGIAPPVQVGEVEWTGDIEDWIGPPRREPFIFVISGRNVPPGRFRRCIDSVPRQKGPRWGAILIDDASEPAIAEHFEMLCGSLGERCTVIRNRRRRGLLANMVTAIRLVCDDPGSVIVTLDADDALIGDRMLECLAEHYSRGADVTIGSMLRTDKAVHYPVQLRNPRAHRGGNVWQHLRSFRKWLFDAIPDAELRLDGRYVDTANDWAFMLPIVEMASHPAFIPEPLYLHEPSSPRDETARARREAVIRRILASRSVSSGPGIRMARTG